MPPSTSNPLSFSYIHTKRDLSDRALGLFDDCNIRLSIKIPLKAQKPSVYHIHFDKLSLLNGLHRAPIFVIDEIVADLVEVEDCDTK